MKKTPEDRWFSCKLNEYHYRRVKFRVHKTMEGAQRGASVSFDMSTQGAQSDLSGYTFAGKSRFEEWCRECDYEIDWENRVLIYKGK